MRQTKTSGEGKGAKLCTACGAKTWMWDAMMLRWQGPYHFQDCPSVPGGAELTVANIEERERWLDEKVVPKEQASRILQSIFTMLSKPRVFKNGRLTEESRKDLMKWKAAIQDEVGKL